MKFIKITQIHSSIGCNFKHKIILRLLGLNKIGKTVDKKYSKSVIGMIKKIKYIVNFKEYEIK